MSLREQMQADVWKVFFDRDELAVEKTINGKPVKVIEDSEQLQKYRQQGISEGTLLLYVPEEGEKGLGYRPEAGQIIIYGTRRYEVELADCNGGIVKLILKQNRGF